MENLNPLYKYLKSSVPLLIGDRSISTYGRRVLKGLRSFHSGWPLPGVYLPTEIAAKVLQKASLTKAQCSDWELFSFLAHERADQKLEEVYDDFLQAKNLRKLVGYEVAAQMIASEEISDKSRAVLYTLLLLKKYSNENNKTVHSFDLLEEACDLLETKNPGIDFHVAEDPKELCVIGFRELYPLEERLLSALGKKYQTKRLSDEIHFEKSDEEIKVPQKYAEVDEVRNLLWVSELDPPAPLEAQLLSGSKTPLRLAVAAGVRTSSPALDRIKNTWPESAEWLQESIQKFNPSHERELLERIHNEKLSRGPTLLQALGFFNKIDLGIESFERSVPLSQNPQDPLLVTLEDLPLLDPAQTALWTKKEKLKEIVNDFCSKLNPLKNFRDIEKHLLAEGIAVPRVEEEQKTFERYFYSFLDSFRILKQKKSSEWERAPRFEIKSTKISEKLSPSALEALYKCPLNFHFSREERLEQFEGEDELDINPIRRGNWVHYTMEALPWSKPEKITRELIQKVLKEKLPKAFDKNASPAYQNILLAQTKAMADALFHYVKAVDIPLSQHFPARKSQSEQDVSTEIVIKDKKVHLRGRVDRLDFVGDGALLWDYKNGNFSNSKLAKHMEDGSFQWLLYKEIFHKEGIPIHGGGYINPLNLKKSRLFFFQGAPMPETFYDNLDANEIKYERISRDEEENLRKTLNDKVESLVEKWSSGSRAAQPLDPSICDYCAHIGRCGHPYGVLP